MLLVEPLNQALNELYVKNRVLRLATKLAKTRPDLVTGKSKIESVIVQYRYGILHVSIDLLLPKNEALNAQERVDQLRKVISADVGEPIVLQLNAVPVEFIQFRSEPAEWRKALIEAETSGN
jgi:hypothetical protein